jgi:hypothetical protein
MKTMCNLEVLVGRYIENPYRCKCVFVSFPSTIVYFVFAINKLVMIA